MKTYIAIKFIAIMLVISFLGRNLAYCGIESTNGFLNGEKEYNKTNPKAIWGEATNFLRGNYFGGKSLTTSLRSVIDTNIIVVMSFKNSIKSVSPAHLYIENLSTAIILAYMPSPNERLALTLADTNGMFVSKTQEGEMLGQTPNLKSNMRWSDLPRAGTGRQGMFSIFPSQFFEVPFSDKIKKRHFELDPTKYFRIQNGGLYKLTIIPRIYIENTNQFLKAITLPPVSVDVRVEK